MSTNRDDEVYDIVGESIQRAKAALHRADHIIDDESCDMSKLAADAYRRVLDLEMEWLRRKP